MYDIPRQLTILHDYQQGFTVVALTCTDGPKVADGLCYDEMLGLIGRLYCPVDGEGKPSRQFLKPLFLAPPSKDTQQ